MLRRGGAENPVSGCGLIEFDTVEVQVGHAGHGCSLSGMVWGHLRLESGLAQDRAAWRSAIRKTLPR